MSIRRTVAVSIALAAPLCAQWVTVRAGAPQPAITAQVFTCSQSALFPTGVVTAPTAIRVDAPCTYFGEYANADLGVTPSPFAAQLTAQTTSYSATAIPALVSAAGSFDVDVRGTVSGVIEIVYSYSLTGQSPRGWLRVDVGGDGTHEVVAGGATPRSGTLRVPVQVAGRLRSTVEFGLHSQGRNPLGGFPIVGLVSVSLRFMAFDAVAFAADGAGCGPNVPLPALSGRDVGTPGGHVAELQVEHGIPNGFVALVFSPQTATLPIGLPPGCSLLVEPDVGTLLPTDAIGGATLRIALGASLPAATLYAQAVPFDPTPRAWASNRLDVTLWP